jgi:predicted Zn-dependent protease
MKRRFSQEIVKAGLLSLVILIQSCGTVPLIGRKQVSLLPESNMVEMSLTSYSQFLKENKLSASSGQTDMVKRVGARVSSAVEKYLNENGFADRVADFKWEFNLVENKEPNAWCMPGGKVVFYSGILPLTQNDAGIAVVMGHEIAHADPHEALGFWERMAANAAAKMPEFLSTHPVEKNRIDAIRNFLPEAMKYYVRR